LLCREAIAFMKKILCILFFIVGFTTYAQIDSILFSKVNLLQDLFDSNHYQPIAFKDSSISVIKEISLLENSEDYPDRTVYLEKRLELLENDLGISFAGIYTDNFNLDPVEDLEENISFQRRIQVGAQWDVLRNGYFENKARARMLQDRIIRERLGNDISKEGQYYLERFDQTVFTFNQLKIKLLKDRSKALKQQYELIRELVFLKKLNKEQLIKIEIRLSEVESLINVYKNYNDYLGLTKTKVSFDPKNLALIDLDYDAIFDLVGVQTDSLLSNNSYVEYLKWYHQVNLRPFVRYNFFDIILNQNRSYFSAGINVTVPLSFDTKLRNEIENEKWKYDNEQFIKDRSRLHEEVLNTAYDFRYQMKDFIGNYQRRKLISERLRIEKAKLRLTGVSPDPFKGLELFDDLMAADVELIEVLQGLYLKALKIHTKIPGTEIEDLIKTESSGNLYEYVSSKQRFVYVWSKTFEKYKSDFLAEYSIYNEFDKVVVAITAEDTLKEKQLFMQYASQNSEIYFMLGNNKLFYHNDIQGYLSKTIKQYKGVKSAGIHLDIEPHTFDNWPTEKENLQNRYVVLVSEVSQFCKQNDLKLEISVPKHYDKFIMDQLFLLANKVYFMCYENVDIAFLVRKLKIYAEEYPEQMVIALRTEDFINRVEMENTVDALQKQLEINEFAYHDLRRMIAFDKQERE